MLNNYKQFLNLLRKLNKSKMTKYYIYEFINIFIGYNTFII